jgi:hypothetical protein
MALFVKDTNGKIWDREQIKALLSYNMEAVEKAIILLFSRQTADEKIDRDVKYLNHRGFDAFRASRGYKICDQIRKRQDVKSGFRIDDKDRRDAIEIAQRGWKQVLEQIAEKNHTSVQNTR